MFDLFREVGQKMDFSRTLGAMYGPTQGKPNSLTFVTAVPARKKTTRSAKNTFHGWRACAMAVNAAVRIPADVRELRDHAR